MIKKNCLKGILISLTFLGLFLCSCTPKTPTPYPTPSISEIQAIPETTVLVGSPLTLNVDVTGDVTGYKWEAEHGTFQDNGNSLVSYLAPEYQVTDLVKVFVYYGNNEQTQKSLQINVVLPPPTDTPTPTETLTPTDTPTPTETSTITPTPASSLLVAGFDSCDNITELGDQMGAAYPDENVKELIETYVEIVDRGCVARLNYDLKAWAGFWVQLGSLDLTNYSTLVFDVHGNPELGIPAELKIDLSRPGQCAVARISEVEAAWKTVRIPLSEFAFGPCRYTVMIDEWTQMEELVFVLELDNAGDAVGQIELDNIRFEP